MTSIASEIGEKRCRRKLALAAAKAIVGVEIRDQLARIKEEFMS